MHMLNKAVRKHRSVALFHQVSSLQMCDVVNEIKLEKERCENSTFGNITSGCQGMWDIIACWPSASVGEVVTITCPTYFSYFSDQHRGNLSKTCTADGWTEMHPLDIAVNCGYNLNSTNDETLLLKAVGKKVFGTPLLSLHAALFLAVSACGRVNRTSHLTFQLVEGTFFWQVKIGYTIGHSISLISLTTAIVILCIFRKLHCTRNYIHMHLFVSFILKAIAVFVKDVVLYEVGEVDNCSSGSVGCKVAIVFFQYCVMASFFWLLVEGLYLHALLAVSFFSERKYFWAYILIGWGGPTVFITAWSIAKVYYNDVGCWDIIENTDVSWWIIKTPILASILMNSILFICIIRILRQKINCPDIGRNESNQYSRLAKSTLLLIPLFGINFIVFAFIPEQVKTELRLVFDLILGSFQGFVVAVLYCFLNGEVERAVKSIERQRAIQSCLQRFSVDTLLMFPVLGQIESQRWAGWFKERSRGSGGGGTCRDTWALTPNTNIRLLGSSSNNFSTQITMLTRCSPKTRRGSSSCHDDLSSI
ncbi:Vasoactive intestinal polypeptide receptor [Collichthys lucidus]|uniref:Vasoactive intestinal polypeptide receptor n=1 Tax=Collichthys lucidus TaxID=240159 RepID=A0A4U5VHG1_COLLU|nr:Vasoactive intestinal polypeptide receptor [Collichthys lucidus]